MFVFLTFFQHSLIFEIPLIYPCLPRNYSIISKINVFNMLNEPANLHFTRILKIHLQRFSEKKTKKQKKQKINLYIAEDSESINKFKYF